MKPAKLHSSFNANSSLPCSNYVKKYMYCSKSCNITTQKSTTGQPTPPLQLNNTTTRAATKQRSIQLLDNQHQYCKSNNNTATRAAQRGRSANHDSSIRSTQPMENLNTSFNNETTNTSTAKQSTTLQLKQQHYCCCYT